MKRRTLFTLLLMVLTLGAFAETYEYTLFSDGMPSTAVVTIDGQEFRGLNAQGGQTITRDTLLQASDITVSVGGGYVARALVDNANKQVDVRFIQMFQPTDSVNAEVQHPYLLKMPLAYVRKTGTSLLSTEQRSLADRFIFIEKTQGQYYIYDQTAKRYIYYTKAANGTTTTKTSTSLVRMALAESTAKTWQLMALSDETVAIIPGNVENPTGDSPALNFTGGVSNGVALNLWSASDSNSAWEILDPTIGSLACATLMYALPGAPYIHKLITNDGETVTSVDLGDLSSTLTLHTDRQNAGNHYAYVSGTAPTEEGTYTYIVKVTDTQGEETQATVTLQVSNFMQSPTPFMGWLTWNWFARSISHSKMVAIAQGMERLGLIDAGFHTIVLDDAWATSTSDKAALTYDATKFPKGISGLKTALQAINPKMHVGIYSDAGSMTCENYQPGSYGYEAEHLALFDSWGVDMLKYDYCNSEASTKVSYTQMGDAVKALNEQRQKDGREPFTFNICEWGKTQPWLWGAQAGGSSWRATSDAREDWIGTNSRPGVLGGVDETRRLWMYAGVNHYNDLDMMCIGLHGLGGPSNNTASHMSNGGTITGLTDAQARTQMSLWCMLSSPLALTCDLRTSPKGEANSGVTLPSPLITDADVKTLTNSEIIALNQDTLGQQAEYMESLSTGTTDYAESGYDVYLKDLTQGRIAVSVTNRGTSAIPSVDLALTDLYMLAGVPYKCHEIWSQTDKEVQDTLSTGELAACETRVYVLTPTIDVTGIHAPTVCPFSNEQPTIGSTSTTSHQAYDLNGRPVNPQDSRHGIILRSGQKILR